VLQSQLLSSANPDPAKAVNEAAAAREAEVADVAQQLESLLLYNLLKEMWATVPEGTLLETGMAGEFYREMWLEALADEISQTAGGIGLADVLAADITRLSL
jgi:Rod binding domain-containing protein